MRKPDADGRETLVVLAGDHGVLPSLWRKRSARELEKRRDIVYEYAFTGGDRDPQQVQP